MKITLPTAQWMAFVLLFLHLLASCGDAQEEQQPSLRADLPPRPLERYRPWDELSDDGRSTASDPLGYTAVTWDVPGTASVEDFWYGGLSPERRTAAAAVMNITRYDVWDCWINHYNAYAWSEMTTENVTEYWRVLGWTQASWDDDGTQPAPASDEATWIELSPEERVAAGNLCYTARLWDGENVTATPTAAPNTESPTGEDFTRYVHERKHTHTRRKQPRQTVSSFSAKVSFTDCRSSGLTHPLFFPSN